MKITELETIRIDDVDRPGTDTPTDTPAPGAHPARNVSPQLPGGRHVRN